MVFINNKKGQAAIEFLMTYGWMLLVVLIVGALIFSFVDFGSLLPNRLELNNNLRGSASESYATAADQIVVVFTYNGAKRVEIANNSGLITRADSIGAICPSYNITNADTGSSSESAVKVAFLNGQIGILRFNCTPVGAGFDLIEGDVLEGEITINTISTTTNLATPSKGPIRLTINS